MNRIYFLRPVGQDGPIKIGCSLMPDSRLLFVHNCSPMPLELVATMPGDHETERELHKRFATARLHGEWFEPVSELVALVDQAAQLGFIGGREAPEKARQVHPLLAKIERFSKRTGLPETQVGWLSIRDPSLAWSLRNKRRSLTERTTERVLRFMAEYQPAQQQSAA